MTSHLRFAAGVADQHAWTFIEEIAAQELGDGRCHGRLVDVNDCGRCSRILTARQLVAMRNEATGALGPRPEPEEPTSDGLQRPAQKG